MSARPTTVTGQHRWALRSLGLATLLSLVASVPLAAATLTGETSRPTYSVFVRGEPVVLHFRVEGLQPGQAGVALSVVQSDAADVPLANDTVPVAAGAQGRWEGTVAGRSDRLGYVQVTARLSTGESLPAVGSREAGYLTYLIVTDPAGRVRPGEAGRFGLQGGWPTSCDLRDLLGVNWVLGEYDWGRAEPDRPGQLAEQRARRDPRQPAPARATDRRLNVMPVFCLIGHIPRYAQRMKDGQPVKGVVGDLQAFGDYCRAVGKAASEDYAHLPHHYYQVTWEPVYPWGFEGSDEDLIRVYEAAYPALHASDPQAVVIGPTGAGISGGDLAWNERLLRKGLGRCLDALCIHPYIAQPPEEHGLVQNVRELQEIIRTYAGRDLAIIGTEQGYPTGGARDREREQARWLVRSSLICVGEGMKCNFSFYSCDYPGEPGYGFFHNLVIARQPWGPGVVGPKPVAGAFAAMTMLLEGHATVGPVEGLGPATLGYAFERDERVTLALWDTGTTPQPIRLPVGTGPIEVFDWMGNASPAPVTGGMLALTLGPAVQYVRGVDPALWGSNARRPIALQANTLAVLAGDTVTLEAVLTPPAGADGTAVLTVTGGAAMGLADASQHVTLKAGEGTKVTVPLAVPPAMGAGMLHLRLTAATGERLWGTTSALVRVSEPLGVEGARPLGAQRVAVRLVNRRDRPATGRVCVRLRGVPHGRAEAAFSVPARQATEVALALPEALLEPGRNYRVEVTARPAEALPVERVEPLAFTDVPRAGALTVDGDLSDWPAPAATGATPDVMVLRGRARLVRQPQLYRGPADLDATVRLAWDERGLYLAVAVRDDHFVQQKTGFDTWQGDCLQVGLDMAPGRQREATGNLLADTAGRGDTEVDLALTPAGPQVYRTRTCDPERLPVGLLDARSARLAVRRTSDGLSYEAMLPWGLLGRAAQPPAAREIGFALTVNDRDAPEQLDPQALGLFGGITPVKDATQFGRLVLVDNAAARATLPVPADPGATGRAVAVLGQSQPAEADPLPWIGCAGVARQDNGDLWAVVGERAYHLDRTGKLLEAVPLPAGMRLARGDGRRVVCLDHEGRFHELNLTSKTSRTLCDARVDGRGPTEFASGRDGALIALYRDGRVRQWQADGTRGADRLRLTPGKDWDYRAVGCDPQTGELWIGTYYPNMKLLRFAPGDTQPRETRAGFAALMLAAEDGLWWLDVSGAGQALRPATSGCRPPQGHFTYYPTGAATNRDGTWVACAQGLVQFGPDGRPTGVRVGGLGGVSLLAAEENGAVLALVENSQRCARLWADDEPGAPLSSQANEPWRVANGWSGKALGLAWMGDGYLVLDATTKALWRFDPDHVAWAEKPWLRLTPEGALTSPRLLACGPARAFVLDGDKLQVFWLSDFAQPPVALALPPTLRPEALVALAASADETMLFVATATRVTALRLDGTVVWESAAGWQEIAGLAATGGQALVADRAAGTVASLAAATGERAPVMSSGDAPGGMQPGALAVMGQWLFVAEARGHRLLRRRLPSRQVLHHSGWSMTICG